MLGSEAFELKTFHVSIVAVMQNRGSETVAWLAEQNIECREFVLLERLKLAPTYKATLFRVAKTETGAIPPVRVMYDYDLGRLRHDVETVLADADGSKPVRWWHYGDDFVGLIQV